MKNMWLIVAVMASFSLTSNNVEARKGVGSLFKYGQGSKAVHGRENYEANTLSVDELRQCLLLTQQIDISDKKLNLEQPVILSRENDLKRVKAEITNLERYLEINSNAKFYSQQQVDKFYKNAEYYNRLIDYFNNELEAYRSLEEGYSSSISSHNLLVSKFDSTCAGKRYYEDDYATVKSSLIY